MTLSVSSWGNCSTVLGREAVWREWYYQKVAPSCLMTGVMLFEEKSGHPVTQEAGRLVVLIPPVCESDWGVNEQVVWRSAQYQARRLVFKRYMPD